jgi:hypothetical protein
MAMDPSLETSIWTLAVASDATALGATLAPPMSANRGELKFQVSLNTI